MKVTTKQIANAIDQSTALTFPWRAMRVTLECGHLRLMPHINAAWIGAHTSCSICVSPTGEDGRVRQVVNVEETGILHDDSWIKFMEDKEEA